MSYLKFDKTVMINLEESLTREVLRTNRLGAYHCTTVVDCNTRKYHGLLVMPVPAIDDDNHVLLSSFDETVIQHGAEFNLGLHKYAGDNFSPKGHKYIREYSSETVPRTLYRVGGVIFSKEKVFSMYENRIMIKYTLEDAHSATTLRFRPFLAFRSVKNLTQANGNVNQSYEEVTNGIKTCMYPGYPELYMQFNKKLNLCMSRIGTMASSIRKNKRGDILIRRICMFPDISRSLSKKGRLLFSALAIVQWQLPA